jgi:hypothetical protein
VAHGHIERNRGARERLPRRQADGGAVRAGGRIPAEEPLAHPLDGRANRREIDCDLVIEAAAVLRLRGRGVEGRGFVVQWSPEVSHNVFIRAQCSYGTSRAETCQGSTPVLRSRAFAGRKIAMRHHNSVRICPDCGGILQPTGTEPLTSAEVAATEAGTTEGACQCLLCGYTAAREPEDEARAESC